MPIDRRELIEYVRHLQTQESDEAKRLGVNLWVVFVGLVYAVGEVIAAVSKLLISPGALSSSLGLAAFAHATVVSCSLAFSVGTARPVTLERRYIRYFAPGASTFAIITAFLMLGIPALAFWLSDGLGASSSPLSMAVCLLRIAKWFWTGFAAGFVLALLMNDLLFEAKGFPMPLGPINRKAKLVFLMVALLAAAGCIEAEALTAQRIDVSVLEPSIRLAGFSVLTVWGLQYLIRLQIRSHKKSELDDVERDLVLEVVQPELAISRLEDRVLGKTLGTWLADEVSRARSKAKRIQKIAAEADAKVTEINSIQSDYKEERGARASRYLEALQTESSEYLDTVAPLIDWLDRAATMFSRDALLAPLLQGAAREVRSCLGDVKSAMARARTVIDAAR